MTKLNTYEREFIQLFRDADEDGKTYIIQVLLCALHFGSEFCAEMEALRIKGDKEGMRECAANWYARGCEMFGVESMTI